MKQLIPNQFLFRFAIQVRYREDLPLAKPAKQPTFLSEEHRLPFLGGMDRQPEFADVRLAWNDSGLALQWDVPKKRQPLYGEVDRPTACDGMSLWLDTRDTRTIHRASRYCHQFLLLSHDGRQPSSTEARQTKIHRALDDAPNGNMSLVKLQRFHLDENGAVRPATGKAPIAAHRTIAYLPAAALHGFDPETNHRLGIAYRLRDRELGEQSMAPGPDFPYGEDPSLWTVLELLR